MKIWESNTRTLLEGTEAEWYLKTLPLQVLENRLAEAYSWHGIVSTGQEGVPLDLSSEIAMYTTELVRRKDS